jgi:hypothetical protein
MGKQLKRRRISFLKFNIFNTKKELKELKAYSERRFECFQSEVDSLKSDIFNLKHPNGEVCLGRYVYFDGGCVLFKYAHGNKIQTSELCNTHSMGVRTACKKVIKGSYAYIGLLFESEGKTTEQYFIVDMHDGKSINCSCQEDIGTMDWIPVVE